MKFLFLFSLITCGLAGCQTTPAKNQIFKAQTVKKIPQNQYHLKFDMENPIAFGGKKNSRSNAAAAGGGMAYPAYNAGGFLAGVLIHAAVQGGVNSARAKKEKEAADKVMTLYTDAIENITVDFLISDTVVINRMNKEPVKLLPTHKVSQDVIDIMPVVYSQPFFSLTQNSMSLILKNTFTFSKKLKKQKKSKKEMPKPVVVEYVFSVPEGNPQAFWREEQYKNFYATTQFMFEESLNLAMNYKGVSQGLNLSKFKTIKYLEGADKKVERGMALTSSCERITFVSLRGSIKSVPKLTTEGCKNSLTLE